MKVLVIASRYPWPPYSGDRLRTTMWLDALAGVAETTLVIPGASSAAPTSANVRIVAAPRRIPNPFSVVRRGLPLHTLMAATHDWRIEGEFDVAIVVLSRLDPWVEALPARYTILDAIDSLAHSMQERARASSFLARQFWSREARAMERLERDAGSRYDRVLLVNSDEAHWFGPRAMGAPIGVPIRPLNPAASRRYDFAYWGRLAYFANRDAATHLANDVWPRIRAVLPSASLVIAGADAPREIRRLDGRNGITVISPASDIAQLARDVRVALFPIHFGTGQLTKVLEAAEAGCAIVATSRAMRGLDPLRPHVVIADDDAAFATAAIDLARSARASDLGNGVRAAVTQHFARDAMQKNLAAIVTGAQR